MNWIALGALNLALAVVTGAFGAHALKARLSSEALGWWHTAVEYHLVHGLGLLLVGVLLRLPSVAVPALPVAGISQAALALQLGIVVFCGSLYAMALGAPRWFGAITPLGGLAFIAGWLLLAWSFLRS